MMNKVIAYIDGFNLYFGLKAKDWKRFYWLDIPKMIHYLLRRDQELVRAKYFTARITHSPEKEKRQNTFLEALGTIPHVEIFYGQYQLNPRFCRFCKNVDQIPDEKMTDVNIAVEMLTDAFLDKFDTAFLVSADSDLAPALRTIRRLFPMKRIVIILPPHRDSKELKFLAHAYLRIGYSVFEKSQLPDRIVKSDGFVLERPLKWR
jgi:uncharacterized LabA/DUF88 family protein